MSREVAARLRDQVRQDSVRRRTYGNVRPLITTEHQGYRFIAVGSRLYYGKTWRTFVDFLFFYARDVMGREWWETEAAKPATEQHPILAWYRHIVELSKTLPEEPDGLIGATPDGLMSAYLLLSYDLYVLRDNGKLQEAVVQRLRNRDQFQGARYELFVAATFVRAELEMEFDDETDASKRHPEFVATDPTTGDKFAVEAKARQRMRKQPFDVAEIRPPIRDLLLNAIGKSTTVPLIVFVEVNLPPEDVELPTWVPHVKQVADDIAAERGASPFGAVFFSNRPHLYGSPAQPDPSKHFYALWPDGSPVGDNLVERLGTATTQYGNVPSKFPDDFGATVD